MFLKTEIQQQPSTSAMLMTIVLPEPRGITFENNPEGNNAGWKRMVRVDKETKSVEDWLSFFKPLYTKNQRTSWQQIADDYKSIFATISANLLKDHERKKKA